MTSLVHIYLLILTLTGVTVQCEDTHFQKYISLISDVHKHYATSSVCFIMPHNNQHSREYTLSHRVSREFSRKGVLTLIINTNEMAKRTSKYGERGDRPLIVVLLTTLEDVNDLIESTRETKISFPIWLLIFTNELSSPLCEYCRKPMKNNFRLRFNTEMLVVCCEDNTLMEWWAVAENETKTLVFGRWTMMNNLQLPANRSLYARRHELDGAGLRVAVVMSSAFEINEGNNFGGFFGALVEELKRVMNFKITTIIRDHGFGSWNAATKSWSGVIGLIGKGEADLGISEFSITNHRLDVVDFTLPLMVSRTQLYFKELDGSGVQWSAHFKAFDYPIWLSIILLVIIATLLVAQIKLRTGTNTFFHLFFENYLYVWGIFCQQGLAVFPIETSLRIAYFSMFVSAIVVSAAYSASLISFITVSNAALPFSSIEEFADDGSYSLIVLQNTSDWDFFHTSSDPVVKKMRRMLRPTNLLPPNVTDGFKQVCSGKVAFFVSQVLVKKRNKDFPCKIVQIDTGSMDSLAMILPAGSQYTGVVNYHIQRFQDNGMMNRLKQMYLIKPLEPETTYDEVSLWGVAPILSVLAGGIVLALIVLLCEITYKNRCKFKRKWCNIHSRRINARGMKIHELFVKRQKQRISRFPSSFQCRTEYFDNSYGQYLP